MSIAKRMAKDGKTARWQVLIDAEDASGGRKRRVIGTFPTKKAAEKAERDALTKRDAGTLLDADSTTVAHLLDTWLADKAATVTSNTVADYRQVIDKHIKPAIGTDPIRKLTAAKLQAQYATWRDAGLSPRMIRGAHMRLSQAFDHAVRLKLILHNPVKDTTPPKLPRAGFD
ncbi:MAG: Arm DNA-binding domain-containing protein, partial [Chloroflexia bacterium]|nr:Arm DNA-binding domain-containing protein [Chloroflexia bacterium]